MTTRNLEVTPIEALFTDDQPRQTFDEALLDAMADTIKSHGILQPILAKRVEGRLIIVDGERRYRAAIRAGLKQVPIILEQLDATPAVILEKQLIANIQREDLRPLELASAIQALMHTTGWNATEAAAELGLSNAQVSRLLALLKLPESIRQRIGTGEIPMSAGLDLCRIADPAEQAKLAGDLAAGKATRDAVRGIAKAGKKKASASDTDCRKRVVAPLGAGRSITVKAEVVSLESLLGIVEELVAKLRKARTQGWSLSTFLKVARDGGTQPPAA